ncbi:GspH/FimT family pseudopilin [Noviherbaspirillum massiliense]|nr:GspH/FimT family pseudopilin [Noviherbaspirillum massiliense]
MERLLRQQAFTLVELVTVVAIVAILAAMAAPSFSTMIANQRARAAATDLHTALIKARSEAIKRNTSVSLVPNVANDWQSGWKIPNPSNPALDIEDKAAVSGVTITGPVSVIFQSSGRIKGSTTPSFEVSAPRATKRWCGSVDLSGRPYLKASSC